MASLVVMWKAGWIIATEAGPCLDKQHCSDCDVTTGHCLTECNTGYFDQKCFSVCDGHCNGNLCNLSADGSGRCTEGCEPGYEGIGCHIPCDSPGGSCTACPGGCDGGYCQLGSSCVSGCVDSYYGTGCKKCSSECTSCNRSTRTCDEKSGGSPGLPVGLSTVAVSFLVGIFLVLSWKYRQRWRRNRVTHTEADVRNNVAEMDDVSVDELEWYTDIPRSDTVMAYESSGRNYRDGGEAAGVEDDVYDVADGGERQSPAVIDNIYSKLSHA
ncbi:scavenger receptor class F member 1-like [Haliotis rubra]|uniref:scavenger receptor class F member 1-like n=1 Tax=Haliotis rubra TaxID=36100 RepID=UPI001EE58E4E|nr:scavenger receptor class F member 1-like [Haliotis rubra]